MNLHERIHNDYWVTKKGIKICPKDMETNHIINTINLLERNAFALKLYEDLRCTCFAMPTGDMARYYAEQELDFQFGLDSLEWLKKQKIYKLLKEEFEKRI